MVFALTRWVGRPAVSCHAMTRCLASSSQGQGSSNLLKRIRRKKLPFITDLMNMPSALVSPASAEEAVDNILYNNPSSNPGPSSRHILNCLVSNEPGVLSRISGIVAARGFNIDSLVVSKTDVPDLSRMTIVLNGKKETVEQAKKQLEDLVPVWAVLDYTQTKIIERELLLAKVSIVPPEHLVDDEDVEVELSAEATPPPSLQQQPTLSPLLSSVLQRQAIIDLVKIFKGRVVDVSVESMVVELCAKPDRIEAFVTLLKPYGIIEATRSGMMAMSRSPVEGVFQVNDTLNIQDEEDGKVDATMLPPG